MRILFIVGLILLTACRHDTAEIKEIQKAEAFKPIPYSLKYNYADTIAKKLVPDTKMAILGLCEI